MDVFKFSLKLNIRLISEAKSLLSPHFETFTRKERSKSGLCFKGWLAIDYLKGQYRKLTGKVVVTD